MCYTLMTTANKPETALYRVAHFFFGVTHTFLIMYNIICTAEMVSGHDLAPKLEIGSLPLRLTHAHCDVIMSMQTAQNILGSLETAFVESCYSRIQSSTRMAITPQKKVYLGRNFGGAMT